MYRWDIWCKIWHWSKYQYSNTNASMGYVVQNMALEQISVQCINGICGAKYGTGADVNTLLQTCQCDMGCKI